MSPTPGPWGRWAESATSISIPSTACFWIQRWKTGMNSSNVTASGRSAKNLTTTLFRSKRRSLPQDLQLQAAAVSRLDEQLRFLDETVRGVGRRVLQRVFHGVEEVLGELRAGEGVPKELRLHVALAELADDLRERVHHLGLVQDELLGGGRHRAQRLPGGLGVVARLERQLRLEGLALRGGQAEVDRRDDLAGALADAHVAVRVLARVAPVGEHFGMLVVGRDGRQVLDQRAHAGLADALDPVAEDLVLLALPQERRGHAVDHLGDALRRHRDHRESVGPRVVLPLAA